MIKIQLSSQSISIQAAKKPGVFPFVATVTHGGKASDRCVGGTDLIKGGPYRVIIPTVLLNSKINDLVGKGVFASEELDTHANSSCIGEFLAAWVEEDSGGEAVAKASGLLYRDRNPELIDRIIEEARAGKLGFSYDLKSVQSKKEELQLGAGNSQEDILVLSDFQWRGATILFKEAAAYEETQLAAQKLNSKKEYIDMEAKELKDLFAQVLTPVIEGLKDEIKGVRTEMNDKFTKLEAAKPEAKKEEKPDQKTEGGSIKVSDFVKSIGDAVKDAVKPLTDQLAAKKVDEKKNVRRSLSASDVEFYGKWADKKEGDELTASDIQAKIDEIKGSNALTNSQKAKKLEPLSAQKRQMLKDQYYGRS